MTLLLTLAAEGVIDQAKLEAARRGNGIVDTEHLLDVLLRNPSPSTRIIERLGLNALAPRMELEGRFKRMVARVPSAVEETPAFNAVLNIAQREAGVTRSDRVATDHILLGLAIEPTGYAGHYLAKVCGVDYVTLRRVVYRRQAMWQAA